MSRGMGEAMNVGRGTMRKKKKIPKTSIIGIT